ncbi:MAG TPA: HAMP domain-containing sensor histidine kinase [Gaiellaceae bacterium]|nr:HAMP domain-containing sensor histidine kinase [Gaiellaceae bacterium]
MIRGIRLRLALALLAVVFAALGAAYLIVVPTLEARLVDAKLEQLEQDAQTIVRCVHTDAFQLQECADRGATLLHARTVVYLVLQRDPQPLLQIVADSQSTVSADVERDPLATRAALTRRPQTGTVTRRGERFAEAALPTNDGAIVLLTSSLEDPLSAVDVVERRLLVAAAIALAVALLVGYVGASVHARRIRRLERAAERIAKGRFDEPVVDGGADELGELAAAFDRMRLRLENLDRARREFIANASHELRTPLFSLGGFLELLDDEELDDATRAEFLTTMREQVDRLAKLATDLLDLSRLDAGRMHLERESVDLSDLALVLCEEFRAVAEQRQHGLRVETDGRTLALADELRVLQAGRALVDNALVHTPPETQVVVRAGVEGDRAVLAVEDDGPGVPEAASEHVFDRFYRVEGDRASGSGLGLAIARELATLMGGDVRLDSRPGRTVVAIELALDRASERDAETAAVFT